MFRNLSPLAWCLGASAIANMVTMAGVLYLAFATPKVYIAGGDVTAYSTGKGFDINDRTPIRVQVVPR